MSKEGAKVVESQNVTTYPWNVLQKVIWQKVLYNLSFPLWLSAFFYFSQLSSFFADFLRLNLRDYFVF